VDLANTKNGIIEEVQHFSWAKAPSRARRVLAEGDTIVGTVRPGNRSYAFIGRMEQQLTASTGFAVLTPRGTNFREFTYCACTSNEAIDHLAYVADGGAYPAVRPDVVAALACVIPPVEVVKAFSQFTAPLFDKITANLSESRTLAALRDLLLPKLMSGEIRLPEAKNLVGDVT
jgi:type I restriction enzyme S subunit